MTPRSILAPARLAGQSVLGTQTDERLVDLVRAGSQPAFEAIVSRYRRDLLRYAGGFLAAERAEDVVQTAFVNAYDSIRSSEGELNLKPWLYRIVHNTALNALRDRSLRNEELDESIDGVERPDQALDRREGLREVLAAVSALPDRQRDALVLRELEGRRYEEIAEELGVTGGAVRQLLNRARNTVRAGATAITPVGLLLRLPLAEPAEPLATRVAELTAGAGAGAMATKVAATALVTGALVTGVTAVEDTTSDEPARAGQSPALGAGPLGGGPGDPEGSPAAGPTPDSERGESRGRAGDDDRGRGRGGDEAEERSGDDDSSGPGPGGGEEDNSGPGSFEDNSGPGGGDGDSSGPGSGGDLDSGGHSGPGGGGSGSGSGDSSGPGDGSGSGSSGSGSGSSGSGSGSGERSGSSGSGSGSSGSGSDGPG